MFRAHQLILQLSSALLSCSMCSIIIMRFSHIHTTHRRQRENSIQTMRHNIQCSPRIMANYTSASKMMNQVSSLSVPLLNGIDIKVVYVSEDSHILLAHDRLTLGSHAYNSHSNTDIPESFREINIRARHKATCAQSADNLALLLFM